jgi:hypothetical protein
MAGRKVQPLDFRAWKQALPGAREQGFADKQRTEGLPLV